MEKKKSDIEKEKKPKKTVKKSTKKDNTARDRMLVGALIIVCAVVVGITSGKLIYTYFNENNEPITEVANK